MARLRTCGFEANDVTLDGITSGTANYSTTHVRSGTTAFNASGEKQWTFTGALGTTYYARDYIYWDGTLPASSQGILVGIRDSGGVLIAGLVFQTDGSIQLKFGGTTSGTTQVGSSYVGLVANQWTRLEVSVNIGSGSVDTIEGKIEGISFASATGQAISDAVPQNLVIATGNSTQHFWHDDLALNDSTGANQNSYPGEGKIVLLVPTADSAVGTGWTTSGAASTGLWDNVNNEPPTGIADTTASAGHQIRNATSNANVNYDGTMTTYSAAGITTSDRVTVIDPVIATGAPVVTSAKAGTVGVVSNPTIANIALGAGGTAGAFWSGVAAGTYPTGWKISHGTVTYNPAVTVGTAPVMRVTQVTSSTRIAIACFMGMYVEFQRILIQPASIAATSVVSGSVVALHPLTPANINATSTVSGTDVIVPTRYNDAEGGVNGVKPTTSDTGSGDPPVAVSPSLTTVLYSNAHPAHGSMGYKLGTGATSGAGWLRWQGSGLPQSSGRLYFYLDGTIDTGFVLVDEQGKFIGAETLIKCSIAGNIFITDSLGSVPYTFTTTISPSTMYRLEWQIIYSSTGTTGTIQVKLFNGDSTSPIEDSGVVSISFAGGNTKYSDFTTIGQNTNIANWPGSTTRLYIDDIALYHVDWIGPSTSAGPRAITPATINATSTINGSVRALKHITPASINGISTVSSNITALKKIKPTTNINATSTVSSNVVAKKLINPTQISATSTLSGSIRALRRITTTTINGTSTVTASIVRRVAITPGQINATSTVTGTVVALKLIKPTTISATSTLTGSIVALRAIISTTISATSTLTGSIVALRPIVTTTISATSTVSGTISRARTIVTTTINAISILSGSVTKLTVISGNINSISSVGGSIVALRAILPSQINATSTVSANVTKLIFVSGNIFATSTVAGSIVARRVILPTNINGMSALVANIVAKRAITPTLISALSTVSAIIVKQGTSPILPTNISATSTISSSVTALKHITTTQINATSTVNGSVVALRRITTSNIAATSTVSASIVTLRSIHTTTISAISTVTATVVVLRTIRPTTIAATSTVSAYISKLFHITTTNINATSTVTGNIVTLRRITTAQINITSIVTGSVVTGRAIITTGISATSVVSGTIMLTKRILPTTINAISIVSVQIAVLRTITPSQINATSTVIGSIVFLGTKFIVPANINATSTVSLIVLPVKKQSISIVRIHAYRHWSYSVDTHWTPGAYKHVYAVEANRHFSYKAYKHVREVIIA